MDLRHNLQICILLLVCCFLVDGKPSKRRDRERRKSKSDAMEKDEMHKFKYKCNKKGVCRYQFSLTVPEREAGNTTAQEIQKMQIKNLEGQLEQMKEFVWNLSQANAAKMEQLVNQTAQHVGILMSRHSQELQSLRNLIAQLENQTVNIDDFEMLKTQFAEFRNQSATSHQIIDLQNQVSDLSNETARLQKLDQLRTDNAPVIEKLLRDIALLQKEKENSGAEKLKEQVADMRKQMRRGQRKQRKLLEVVDVLKNKTRGGKKIIIHAPGLDEYEDEYRKNFSSLSVRVNKVERLFYGYASGDKYIYLMKPSTPRKNQPSVVGQDCAILRKRGLRENGVYEIQPDPTDMDVKFFAYCDMITDGGGWTVVQRRQGGVENFNMGWNEYKNGFGENEGEFWLGLEKMYKLNKFGNNEIRFDMWDFHSKYKYAMYKDFRLANETDKYRIEVGRYEGTAGDAFHYANVFLQQNRQQFTTKDNDNDMVSSSNCATEQKGGWWYQFCGVANLNGNFYDGGKHLSNKKDGILWQPWHLEESLRRTEIKIRPLV